MWIEHVPDAVAHGRLRLLYDRVKGPDGHVDNIMRAHSLRPHSMEGHMALYKSVLHHSGNQLPKWFLETLGVYTSLLNRCEYCVEHHFAGLQRLLNDDAQAFTIRVALEHNALESFAEPGLAAALGYARQLTVGVNNPVALRAAVEDMRSQGLDDGRILEVNQALTRGSVW